ncbi:hypothetical protein BH10PSE7_BH10PSE7_43400 [soil metagenome]
MEPMPRIPIVLLACAVMTLPACGADLPGRYAIERVSDGILRLDSVTGIVSICSPRRKIWSCRTIRDDAEALRLENERLKARVAEFEETEKTVKLQSDGDVHRMMQTMGRLVDRLMK